MTILTVFSILIIIASIVCAIIALIKRLAKKSNRILRRIYIIGLGAGVVSLVLSFVLTPGTANVYAQNYEPSVQTEVGFEVEDGDEPLDVITSEGLDWDSSSVLTRYYRIFDSSELSFILDNCHATKEDCLEAIKNNSDISETYKEFFSDFVERIARIYPDAELSILCYNLESLKVCVLDKNEFYLKSLSVDSYGCYMRSENTIYIPEGTEYIEGEWGFQVLIHEFCHAARTCWREYEDEKDKIQFCANGDNTLLEEAMNSAFSCSLLNYYEKDIAYQVPSNYLRIMLECMDNYDLSDYLSHSDLYFLSKLDEYTDHTNYSQVMWNLIALQRSDWEDDSIDIPAEEYYPIYEYLCDMYYGKYITVDMTDKECLAIAGELVEKAFYDAPEGYKIDENFFYEYLGEYR